MSNYEGPEFQAQMSEFLLDLARLSSKATESVDGTALRRERADLIDELITFAKENTILNLSKETYSAFVDQRVSRSFEGEFNRTWNSASAAFEKMSAEAAIESLPPIVSEQIFSDGPTHAQAAFEKAAALELKMINIPALEKHEAPGDNLFLYFLDSCYNSEEGAVTDQVAETLRTPSQTLPALLATFGLLIQARRSEVSGNLTAAFSYLMDASRMLGMIEASTWITSRFDKIAASRNGKSNARKDTPKKRAFRDAKLFVEHLFHSLMPTSSVGVRAWKSADQTKFNINAYICDHKIKIGISDDKIEKECERLYKLDRKNFLKNKFRILAFYKHVKKDGTEINIPIPLNN